MACAGGAGQSANERPDHHGDDGRFVNPVTGGFNKTLFTYMRMRAFDDTPYADHEKGLERIDVQRPPVELLESPDRARPQVTWLGHASFLIQYNDLTILTDPVLTERVSPVNFAGPRRLIPLPVEPEELPSVDLVVISHNHYDHLDAPTIDALGDEPHYAVPLGLASWFEGRGIESDQVTELDWWESLSLGDLTVTATPAQHWSRRGVFDGMKTLWSSWLVDMADFSVWFAGDTGYNDEQFREVGERLGPVDLSLVPVGAYKPRWFMAEQHVNPEEALMMHRDVGARLGIAMHWGTFQLSGEGYDSPRQRTRRVLREGGHDQRPVIVMDPGEVRVLEEPQGTGALGSESVTQERLD